LTRIGFYDQELFDTSISFELMSEWCDNKNKLKFNSRKLLQEQIDKASPRRKLTSEEEKCHCKLEAIADKLKRGENVQNRQLKTWLSEEEIAAPKFFSELEGNIIYKDERIKTFLCSFTSKFNL